MKTSIDKLFFGKNIYTMAAEGEKVEAIAVKDGKIGVTAATCPDHTCMDRGMCSNGVQIVCLPNKLIIRFLNDQTVDSMVG